jgi:rhodanese-related sulfurtransferase/polyisoprenoid-binding protein YceI
MLEQDDLVLIDTLTADHFKKVHVPGARNACVFEVVFLENMEKIIPEKDKRIVVYGSSGKSMDAVTAAEKLVRAGYQEVFALEGGLQGWKASGYDLDGDDPSVLEDTGTAPRLEDRTYVLDREQSMIEWTGRNPNTTHYGTLNLSQGHLLVENGHVSGTFEIDMKSMKNINLEGDPLQPVLIAHLMSDDFFFVSLFPKAVFTIRSARPITGATPSEPNFEVKGVLELRGVKKEMEFLATAHREPEGEVKVESHFDMDRTQWGVIYGSTRFFEYLGMHLVFDLISIQLRLVLS